MTVVRDIVVICLFAIFPLAWWFASEWYRLGIFPEGTYAGVTFIVYYFVAMIPVSWCVKLPRSENIGQMIMFLLSILSGAASCATS